MITGLYSAATALDAAEARHRIASENLAHIHQPGHRRRIIEQTTFEHALSQQQDTNGYAKTLGANVSETTIHVDHSSGVLEQTRRPLDLAIQGDGFFTVEGPEGPLYTKNGRFHVNPNGDLVNVDGLPVRSQGGGPLTLPVGASPSSLTVGMDGTVAVNGAPIGQLELTGFERLQELQPAGASLFSDPGTAGQQDAQVQVMQGYVERSNVSPIDELVNIMVSSRQYEAATKIMTAIDRTIEQRIDLN
jgi:flagellar basal-body rod protein FlgF